MTTQRKQDDGERRQTRSRPGEVGTDGDVPIHGADGGDTKHERRLDVIEWADDRTQALDPRRGLDDDPIDDLLGGRGSKSAYRREARQIIPTLGPASESELDR